MLVTFANLFFSDNVLAQDLSGIWQQIDDETGSPKAIIEIQINNSVTRRFIKITPLRLFLLKKMHQFPSLH